MAMAPPTTSIASRSNEMMRPTKTKETANVQAKRVHKKRKQVTACPHVDAEYYAKGMCRNCYHSQGRQKQAASCPHGGERKLYAKGMCKACYLRQYNKQKKDQEEALLQQQNAEEQKTEDPFTI